MLVFKYGWLNLTSTMNKKNVKFIRDVIYNVLRF
jgi:hypothetical protein